MVALVVALVVDGTVAAKTASRFGARRNGVFTEIVVAVVRSIKRRDDAFRQLFQEDARAALRQVGHETAADEIGLRGRDPVMCMVLSNGLASKAALCAGRDRIRHSLISTQVQAVFNISAN